MPRKPRLSAIVGDVIATTDVTVNTKGGSMTATLKKTLREKLGTLNNQLSAAAVEFATGQTIVLLSGALRGTEASASVHVRKLGRNRFEIELETDDDKEIDEVTAAFLRLKKDQFEKGKLRLSGPITADGWRAAMDEAIGPAKAAMEAAETAMEKA